MIVFDLTCGEGGETFEAWFRSTADFEEQASSGLISCPLCGSANVRKAPMAPSVPRKATAEPLARLAALQNAMLEKSRWVGADFADTARAMHAGDAPPELVHGSATLDQAKSLVQEGVPVTPLPLPIVPPAQVN